MDNSHKDKTLTLNTGASNTPERSSDSWRTFIWRTIIADFDVRHGPCTHSPYLNITCALSNWIVFGILALYFQWDHPWRRWTVLAALIASTIYHLAEVKSRLPGLPYLRKHARWLIQLDRLCAFIAGLDILYSQYLFGFQWRPLVAGLVGALFALMSEGAIGWRFVWLHSIWHNFAFLALRVAR